MIVTGKNPELHEAMLRRKELTTKPLHEPVRVLDGRVTGELTPQPYASHAIADAQARKLLVSGQHKAATEYVHPFLNTNTES